MRLTSYTISLLYNPNIYFLNGVCLFILLFDSRMRFCSLVTVSCYQ
ncbi:hypothetical protein MGSAQ_000051 [marine sediment metagenome]|uniref:Uncharacterized protein n=1 Tax=marine sediment metagenome TaxID=412755 RepID=A0A1B6NZ85_9ZZZZ